MALSAAERARRYRQRRDADPQKRASYLQKEKNKYAKDKRQGIKKSVKDMTEREKRKARKQWRNYKRQRKIHQNLLENIETPPTTPESRINNNNLNSNPLSRQKLEGQKVIKRNRQKMKREIERLKLQLSEEKKRSQMYRKRLYRIDKHTNTASPRSKANKLLKCFSPKDDKNTKQVKRTLTFHYALIEQLKNRKQNNQAKLSEITVGAILRKYKFRTRTQRELGVYGGRVVKSNKKCVSLQEREKVKKFFERSDVSRITTGVKSTLTKRKQKHQKRLLTDTLTNVYKLYRSETKSKISFTTFYRLKPFWVVSPNENDRDTCLCKLCENIRLTSKALLSVNAITSQDKKELWRNFVCDENNKACMYRRCSKCKDRRIVIANDKLNDTIQWKYWVTQEKEITKNGKGKVITTVVKQNRETNVSELLDKFNDDMKRYTKHSYNILSQNNFYKKLKDSLTDAEALISVDFSENYMGKMDKEIQSMHFGASKPQMSLHTGIYYVGQRKGVSFTTVSDCLEHGPAGVWGHLSPILKEIKNDNPEIQKIHIFSDGPVTQYKQKGNFYLFSREMETLGMTGTWNYHESGHGRGIPDGIGAIVKRTANKVVLNGNDVMSAKDFVEKVRERTKVKLIEVKQNEINTYSDILSFCELKPVPGTLSIHQVKTEIEGVIKVRDLSCTCQGIGCCEKLNPERTVKVMENGGGLAEKIQPKKEPAKHSTKKSKSETYSFEKIDYAKYLKEFQKCKSYEALKQKVSAIKLPPIQGEQRYMVTDKLTLDDLAFDDLPDDFEVYPVTVKSDGDCLPSCGSVYLFGHGQNTDQVRLRIIQELCTNDELYLSPEYLIKGTDKVHNLENLAKHFAMYSDFYMPGITLSNTKIRKIFEAEVMSICTPKTFMGIWQLYALSSVLCLPLYSVYPELGNPIVRQHLHRTIQPRLQSSQTTVHIMWTSTRNDMLDKNWVPNHFVPLLPIAPPDSDDAVQPSIPTSPDTNSSKTDLTENTLLLLNKFVAVRYDGKPYPGQVIDVSESEVFVRCLHQVGKTKNEFYWPKLVKDECWYELGNIIVVLDEPQVKASTSVYKHLIFKEWETIK